MAVLLLGASLMVWSVFIWTGYQGGHLDRGTFYVCATIIHAAWLVAAAIWTQKH